MFDIEINDETSATWILEEIEACDWEIERIHKSYEQELEEALRERELWIQRAQAEAEKIEPL